MSETPPDPEARPELDPGEISKRAVPIYRKIGRLIVAWNGAERVIKSTVGELLGVSPSTCDIIMGSTQIRANWAIYTNVIKERANHPDIINVLNEANSSMEEIYSFRNDVVHGNWWLNQDGDFVITRKTTPISGTKSLEPLSHYIYRTREFKLRLDFIRKACHAWMLANHPKMAGDPSPLALIKRCLSKLHHDLANLGPVPPKDGDAPPPTSSRSGE